MFPSEDGIYQYFSNCNNKNSSNDIEYRRLVIYKATLLRNFTKAYGTR